MFTELWPGGPVFRPAGRAFPLSTDSVLLARFAAPIRAKKIMALGCGAGVLGVLLHVSHPAARLYGVEIQPDAAAVCRENFAANGFDYAGIVTGDLREYRTLWPAGFFDLAVSNPPYFAAGSGYTAPDRARAAARDERNLTLDDLCDAAGYLCRWGGAFALVHRPERLSEIICAMTARGIEPKRLRFVQHRADTAPSLALIEGRRGGKPGLRVGPPLVLCGADGADSEEVRKIYHR